MSSPQAISRRSALYRWHEANGARFDISGETCFVKDYRVEKCDPAEAPGICDLSLLRRSGFRGRAARDWLSAHIDLPTRSNASVRQAGGALVSSLSQEEFLIIESPDVDAGLVSGLDKRFHALRPANVYALPRSDSHCLFAIAGEHSAVMLAKLCGVDLRTGRFELGAVAQTSVARVNAIVIRGFEETTENYYLLADVSTTEYLWQCVLDAMDEYSGTAIGIDALRAVSSR